MGYVEIHPNVKSVGRDAILTTNYLDNYIIKGNIFTYDFAASLIAETPVRYTIELPEGHGLEQWILIPRSLSPTIGYITVEVYEDTEFTGGSLASPVNRNRESNNLPTVIIKVGATGTTIGTKLPFTQIYGSESTNQFSGGGSSEGSALNTIVLDRSKRYCVEVTASDTGVVGLSFEEAEI